MDQNADADRRGHFKKFIRRWGREIITALILALIAAVIFDWWNTWQQQQVVQRDLSAVVTLESLDSAGNLIGQGSGFFIDSNGLLATNYHVIEGAADVRAVLPTGAYYEMDKIVSGDPDADVAILQFKAKDTPFVNLGNSDALQPYQKVYAIGTPVGLQDTISNGVISNPQQTVEGRNFIQFTAAISPGSSGGGLFDEKGDAVGITANSRQISSGPQAGEAQNLNLAVPINDVKVVVASNQNLSNGSPAFYYSQGVLADGQQRWDNAIADYNQALQSSDQNILAQSYMGLAGDYYEKGQYNLEVSNYLKSVQADPTNPDAFYYLGTAYEDVGQYDKAIDAYKTTLRLNPTYKDAIHDLALVYLATGDKVSASSLVPQLQQLDPGWGGELELLLTNQK